jgi:hypothetical protein
MGAKMIVCGEQAAKILAGQGHSHYGSMHALWQSCSKSSCVLCTGAPKTLFGFDGQQLVGQPLSSAINIFTDWKQGHGEELSLLELLVRQLMSATSQAPAGKAKGGSGCDCWRVGVHRPIADDHHSELVRLCLGFCSLPACHWCGPLPPA